MTTKQALENIKTIIEITNSIKGVDYEVAIKLIKNHVEDALKVEMDDDN